MESTRQQKVAKLIHKEMSQILEFEMRHLYAGAMVTLTKTTVTRDLSIARSYLSIFAAKDKKAVVDEIRKHTPELRYKLGQRIRRQVRIIPHLEFFEDDSLDYIENIDRLLNES